MPITKYMLTHDIVPLYFVLIWNTIVTAESLKLGA